MSKLYCVTDDDDHAALVEAYTYLITRPGGALWLAGSPGLDTSKLRQLADRQRRGERFSIADLLRLARRTPAGQGVATVHPIPGLAEVLA